MSKIDNNGVPVVGFRAISVSQFLINGGGILPAESMSVGTVGIPANSVGCSIQARLPVGFTNDIFLYFGSNANPVLGGYKMHDTQFYYAGQTPFSPGGDPQEILQPLGIRGQGEDGGPVGAHFVIQFWRLA